MKASLDRTLLGFCLALIASAILLATPARTAEPVWIIIDSKALVPEDALVGQICYVLHDGSFDAFDLGRPASDLVRAVATRDFDVGQYFHELATAISPAFLPGCLLHTGSGSFDATNAISFPHELLVVPEQHRYLSLLAMLSPTDDAFIGHDSPTEIRLFDDDGNFLGPLLWKATRDHVFDAGVAANDETDIPWLDLPVDQVGNPDAVPEESVVRRHPGLNGSEGNPDGTPQRVLGGSFSMPGPGSGTPPREFFYDPDAADFTKQGYEFFEILVHAGVHAGYGGVYRDPQYSGEGFTFEVSGGTPGTLSMTWYTYHPDGSGAPFFLVGAGTGDQYGATIDLTRADGGGILSTDNPQTVERSLWGRVRLNFQSCTAAHLRIEEIYETDPTYLNERTVVGATWQVERITGLTAAQQRTCRGPMSPMPPF